MNTMLYSIRQVLGTALNSGLVAVVMGTAIPALTQAPLAQEQSVSLPPNVLQLLDDFDLISVACSDGVATIAIGQGTVCVKPTARIAPGNYYYDPETDEIVRSPNQNPKAQTSAFSPHSAYQFTFTRVSDYGDCLEDILQFYQARQQFWQQSRRSDCLASVFQSNAESGLTKEQALEIIAAANRYATSSLSPQLYPPRGLRQRITQEFGFVYPIDH